MPNIKDRIQSWYPDEQLSEYELNEQAAKLAAFFMLGANVAYRLRKDRQNIIKSPENRRFSENNCVNPQKSSI
jgi:hypothetical protein